MSNPGAGNHYVAEVTQQAILFDDGEILMLQYDADHSWWTFPGGRLHDGEATDAGLVREVREETGLTVDVVQPVFTTAFEQDGTEKLGVASLCRFRDDPDAVELGDEHRAYRWVEPTAVASMNTASGDYEAAVENALRLRETLR